MTHVTCRLTAKPGNSSGTLRSAIEYGLPLPLHLAKMSVTCPKPISRLESHFYRNSVYQQSVSHAGLRLLALWRNIFRHTHCMLQSKSRSCMFFVLIVNARIVCGAWCTGGGQKVLQLVYKKLTCYVSALTLLVERQEGHPACKLTWVVRYWHSYLCGARCILAYGPADATATHCLLLQ